MVEVNETKLSMITTSMTHLNQARNLLLKVMEEDQGQVTMKIVNKFLVMLCKKNPRKVMVEVIGSIKMKTEIK